MKIHFLLRKYRSLLRHLFVTKYPMGKTCRQKKTGNEEKKNYFYYMDSFDNKFQGPVEAGDQLAAAINSDDLQRMQLLIEEGLNINTIFLTPEAWYADKDDPSFHSIYECTALLLAIMRHRIEMAKLLIEKGADLNQKSGWDESTALHLALKNRLPEIAELIIERGADINTTNKWGSTALSIASEKGYTEIVQLLKKEGANE